MSARNMVIIAALLICSYSSISPASHAGIQMAKAPAGGCDRECCALRLPDTSNHLISYRP